MVSHFELLSLSPAFDLDLNTLEQAYFREQRVSHPDRFTGKPADERGAAMQRSVDINHAYNTLKNPLTRAQYLLQLQGITVGTERDSVKPSQDILIEAMELREEPKPKEQLQQMIDQSIARIAEFYKKSSFAAMAQETIRLGYVIKATK